jgi:DNA-binding CsgD family transcriptional regulator
VASSTAVRRVARICESVDDDRVLRGRLLDEVRRVMPFDAHVWLLTDPESCVGSAPLAEVPCMEDLPRLIRLKYLTPVNRWTTLSRGSVATLQRTTGGDLSTSLVWRGLLRRHQIGDVASTVFRDRFGCWGFLDLWRNAAVEPFGESEVAFLRDVNEVVTRALRRCQAGTFTGDATAASPSPDPVVLLLSPDLHVLGRTPATEGYLRQLLPTSDDSSPVPAAAYNVAAQLLACEACVDDHPAVTRLHLLHGRWLSLAAARVDAEGRPAKLRDIAVTVGDATVAERVGVFSRAFGLTPREHELLGRLVTGSDTHRLAGQMHLSEHTVQDHLKVIFAKTSTHSRRSLLSLAVGGRTAT